MSGVECQYFTGRTYGENLLELLETKHQKPVSEVCILYDSIYLTMSKQQYENDEKRINGF